MLNRKAHKEAIDMVEGQALELAHVEIFCSIGTPLVSSPRYFMPFVDNFSQKSWLLFIK